ncbi:FecR family protein [Chitinophaga sp. GCM10012297]|uniref:FecR domain-containing protein n=1 Tax=Chitinophaga chungangae TaxID=2821488 RepID=A0ABS3YKG9_9BACT|nr:FecR family protein [Chitinophaga chungangae]MBO9155191.1 FecR domain-containing protein [Chitinophaga chungangae]
MDQQRIDHLLKQYAAGELTEEEQQELEALLAQPGQKELEERIAAIMGEEGSPSYTVSEERSNATFGRILSADKPLRRKVKPVRRWLAAAAAVLLVVSAGGYFLLNRSRQPVETAQSQPLKPEKAPGRNTAILYLADSSAVELDSLGNGILAAQGGTRVMMANGQLSYLPQPGGSPQKPAFNRIVTPRGGEFTIVLPDGTRVWLNAASSLIFPTAFSGAKREVELTGEAYMQVAEDKAHPFEVKIREVNISVLGTQFNIMGYEDESGIVTTLVSGSVRVTAPGNDARLLTPGQHAVVDRSGALRIEKADVAEETAWKNGRIYFERANIRQIMRQVSRWYDIDIEYRGNVADMDFTCTVSRRDKLSKLLALLEMTGAVHFTMEGNTIVVQP